MDIGRRFFLIVSLLLFSSVSLVCLAEVQARIAARSLLQIQVDSIADSLLSLRGSQVTSIKQGDVGQSLPNDSNPMNLLRANRQDYETLLQDLTYLELAGAGVAEQTLGYLRGRINEISERTRQDRLVESIVKESDRLQTALLETNKSIRIINERISRLNRLRDASQAHYEAEVSGVGGSGIPGIGPRAREIQIEIDNLNDQTKQAEDTRDRIRAEIQASSEEFVNALAPRAIQVSLYYLYNPFAWLPTEILIALIMVSSGAIGALLSSARKTRSDLPVLVPGLVSGFVTYLVVKGGRFFFIVTPGTEDGIFLNPFSVAFAATAIGMFSEKAYLSLETIFGNAADRITEQTQREQETDPPVAKS